jgi:hypothetical protein
MRVLLSYLALVAVVLIGETAGAQDTSRQLTVLMGVSGTCSELVLAGESLSCQGALLHTEYDDGRIGFYFVAEAAQEKIITFSGRGQDQKSPSKNVRIQPIDGLVLSDGIVRASGECLFESPYAGPARIWCRAKSAAGVEYRGQFLTDGGEPKIMDLGGEND